MYPTSQVPFRVCREPFPTSTLFGGGRGYRTHSSRIDADFTDLPISLMVYSPILQGTLIGFEPIFTEWKSVVTNL